jgi:hypothetical protein
VENYFSPVTKSRGLLLKQASLKTLPRFLLVALKKFVALEGWQPTKLDVSVPLPGSFDFAQVRWPAMCAPTDAAMRIKFMGHGLQPGEVEMDSLAGRPPARSRSPTRDWWRRSAPWASPSPPRSARAWPPTTAARRRP